MAARRALLRLSGGSEPQAAEARSASAARGPGRLLREAKRRYGVGANYLAAIHLVETKFGRVKNNSVAGAQGPMQFIPSTWRIYGNGGNIQDPHDAILGAANLLRAQRGAAVGTARALRAYNDSGLYVDAPSRRYAREIAANPYALYYLYSWRP